LALSACATKQKVPEINYDDLDFDPAIYQPEPAKPVKVVKLPKPLPLPGQMKKAPKSLTGKSGKRIADKRPPKTRVVDANKAAKIEPSKDGYINAIQNYPFVKGALYQLYAAVNQVSDIALEPGEKLVSVSAGDTVRWVVGDTTSGASGGEQVHILVKPIAPDLQTNLVINTDRRTYHLEMRSTDETYMASVSWIYPYSDLLALQKRNRAATQTAKLTIDQGLQLDKLKFRYTIKGDAPWKPVRAFDDGKKVYLQFPSGLRQGDAPPLFIVGSNGKPALVNYRVKDNYYIVDRLFAAAELRFGTHPQQVVRITRTDATYRTVKASRKNIWGIRHDR
jgi:type IV secretion system protein VirB9